MARFTGASKRKRKNSANVMSLRDLEKEFREVSQRLARLDESIRNLKDSSDDFAIADASEFTSLKKRAMQLSDKIKRMKTQEAASKSFSAGTSPFAALASRRAGVVKSEEDAAWDEHRGPRDNATFYEMLDDIDAREARDAAYAQLQRREPHQAAYGELFAQLRPDLSENYHYDLARLTPAQRKAAEKRLAALQAQHEARNSPERRAQYARLVARVEAMSPEERAEREAKRAWEVKEAYQQARDERNALQRGLRPLSRQAEVAKKAVSRAKSAAKARQIDDLLLRNMENPRDNPSASDYEALDKYVHAFLPGALRIANRGGEVTIVETLPVIVDTRTASDAMFALRKRAGTAISAHANNQYSMLVARLLSSVANLATVLSEPDATDESIAEARDIVDTILSHLHMEMMMAGEYAKRDNRRRLV